MMNNPYQKYQQSAVQTASPAQQLIMLYDGLIRFLKIASEAIDKREIEKSNLNIQKAQSIINEFIAMLDHNYPISKDLMRIYEYWLEQIIGANMRKQKTPIVDVLSQIIDLRETWVIASKTPVTQAEIGSHA